MGWMVLMADLEVDWLGGLFVLPVVDWVVDRVANFSDGWF